MPPTGGCSPLALPWCHPDDQADIGITLPLQLYLHPINYQRLDLENVPNPSSKLLLYVIVKPGSCFLFCSAQSCTVQSQDIDKMWRLPFGKLCKSNQYALDSVIGED